MEEKEIVTEENTAEESFETEEAEIEEAETIETAEAPEEDILPEEDEIIEAEQDVSASDLSYLYEPGDDGAEGEWLDAAIEEAGEGDVYEAGIDASEAAEEAGEADEDSEADDDTEDEAGGEGDDIDNEAEGDEAEDGSEDDEAEDEETEEGEEGGETEGEEADETEDDIVNTQNFYEQYGDEIRAYLSGHVDEDPIEEYEEEHAEEEEEQPPKKKKKRRKKHYFIRFLVVVGVIAAVACFLMSSYFDIKQIDVEGTKNLKKSQIVKLSGIETGTNIFKLHKKEAEQKLLDSSYIAHVEIKRDFPGTVKITVLERRESAAVKYGKDYLIIDPDGYVLRTVKKLPKRTLLSDMKIKSIEVGKKLEVTDEKKFEQALTIIKAMKETNLYFKKIEFGKTKVKAYIYDSLVCVGKYEDLLKSIEDGNLSQVARDLYSKKIRKGTVKVDGGKYISYDPNFK